MKKIALLAILCTAALDLSAAGANLINQTGDWVAVEISFDNNTTQACLLPGKYPGKNPWQVKLDGGTAGLTSMKYLKRGVVRQIGLNIPGIEGIRDYTIADNGISINNAPWPQKAFTNPLGSNEVARGGCDTCAACDSCCKPTSFTITPQ